MKEWWIFELLNIRVSQKRPNLHTIEQKHSQKIPLSISSPMHTISQVKISPDALDYLIKRGLEKQYLKTKKYILEGHTRNVDLKVREPKKDKVWYFRINNQFRAICELEGNILYVLAIDNHQ